MSNTIRLIAIKVIYKHYLYRQVFLSIFVYMIKCECVVSLQTNFLTLFLMEGHLLFIENTLAQLGHRIQLAPITEEQMDSAKQ